MTDLVHVLDRVGGRRGLIDGAVPPLLFASTNGAAGPLGHADRALSLAVTAATAAALALGVLRRVQGTSLAGVARGLAVLAVAAGSALGTGHARDFFLPGMYVDAGYTIALAGSVAVRRPLIGYAYAALFRDRRWRHDPRLRRVLGIATLGWAATYAVRAGAQLVLYRADEPGLLAVAKLALGWPLTAAAVILTLRAARHVRGSGRDGSAAVLDADAAPSSPARLAALSPASARQSADSGPRHRDRAGRWSASPVPVIYPARAGGPRDHPRQAVQDRLPRARPS